MEKNKLMNLLFNEQELICTGNLYTNSVLKLKNIKNEEFFCINSLASVDLDYKKKEKYSYTKARRADINVNSYRNFLFEMDSLPLAQQMFILTGCGIEWTSIVYSGGKSYHAILSLDRALEGCHTEPGLQRYKQVWRQIEAYVTEYAHSCGFSGNIIDPSCKNPSRFSRFPGFKAEGRERQDLLYVGKRMKEDAFEDLLMKCPQIKISDFEASEYEGSTECKEEFFSLCPEHLKFKILYPMNIGSEGNYPELFRTCLWAIDATGLSRELMVELCVEYIFPKYNRAGYPAHKWFNAIDDAFATKGRG